MASKNKKFRMSIVTIMDKMNKDEMEHENIHSIDLNRAQEKPIAKHKRKHKP